MKIKVFFMVLAAVAAGYFFLADNQPVKQVIKNVSPADIAANWSGPEPVWQKPFLKTGRFHETFNNYIKVVNASTGYRQELLAKLENNRAKCLYYITGAKGDEAIYVFANFSPLPPKRR